MPTDRSSDPIAASISAKPPGFAGQPLGLSTLFFTEMWERFTYYGMRALLVLFIVAPIAGGGLGFAHDGSGTHLRQLHDGRVHAVDPRRLHRRPLPRGLSLGSDRRSIIACGHFTHGDPDASRLSMLGLALIALGTGLFKPNISAMVGRPLRAR